MYDHQRLIDDIQSLLQAGDALALEGLGPLAADYAAVCDQANERLRACGDLLRRGLRSEALQQAEHEPKLVDLVALLDFPDAAVWRELLSAHRFAQPPALLLEVAAELNEAYALEQPLTALLRQHRWHALARSPLNKRIAILREVTDADPLNLVWIEDLHTFERARHQQIEQEATLAVKARDAERLGELESELRDTRWTMPPSQELVRSTAQARSRVQSASAVEELGQLAHRLNDAFSAFDLELGRTLRSRWQACVALARLPADSPLIELATPALSWLADEDESRKKRKEYAHAIASLEAALDDEEPRAVLERRYHALAGLEMEIPDLLQRRYHERMEFLNLTATRRNRLLIGVAAACLLLVAGLIGVVVFRQVRGQEVAARSAVLKALLAENKLDEARGYLDDLTSSNPELAATAEIQEQQTRLAGLEQQETRRRAAFRVAVERALSAGADRPDDSALAEARRLAHTDAERLELLKFEGTVQAVQQRLQGERDQRFAEELQGVTEQFARFEAGQREPGETPANGIARISRRVSSLLAGAGLVGRELQQQANLLKSRLDSHVDLERRKQREVSLLDRLTAAVGDAGAYRSAQDAYVKEYPDSPRALAFQRVAAEEPALWEGLERWNQAIDRWTKNDLTGISPQAAKALAAETQPLLSEAGDYPQAEGLKQRVAYLQTVAARVAEDGTRIHLKLLEVFTDPAVASLWLVSDRQGGRYYSKTQPQPLGQRVRVKFLTGFDFSEESVSLALSDILHNERAPQSVISAAAVKDVTGLTDARWEPVFVGLLEKLHSDAKLDPVLKVILLRRVLDVACQGSQMLAILFDDYRQRLNSPDLKLDANWLKPNDSDAATARIVAEGVLGSLTPPRDTAPALAQAKAELVQPFAQRYAWAGWLVKDEALGWSCRTRPTGSVGGDLHVAYRPVPSGAVTIRKIGELRLSGASLSAGDETAMFEGRPVFVAIAPDR